MRAKSQANNPDNNNNGPRQLGLRAPFRRTRPEVGVPLGRARQIQSSFVSTFVWAAAGATWPARQGRHPAARGEALEQRSRMAPIGALMRRRRLVARAPDCATRRRAQLCKQPPRHFRFVRRLDLGARAPPAAVFCSRVRRPPCRPPARARPAPAPASRPATGTGAPISGSMQQRRRRAAKSGGARARRQLAGPNLGQHLGDSRARPACVRVCGGQIKVNWRRPTSRPINLAVRPPATSLSRFLSIWPMLSQALDSCAPMRILAARQRAAGAACIRAANLMGFCLPN